MDLSWVSDFATPNLPASKGFLVRYWRKNSRSGVFRDESGSGDVVDASSQCGGRSDNARNMGGIIKYA